MVDSMSETNHTKPLNQQVSPPARSQHSVNKKLTIPTKVNDNGLREVPPEFEKCEIEDLIELTAAMLKRLIDHNDQIPLSSTSLTRFHSRSPPSISIKDYLNRIYRYTNVEPISFILILNYIDRICENLQNFTICSLTVHRFSITSVTVGSKSISDSFYSNSRYAKVGGIGLGEMNLLEREFLIAIDYRLMTTLDVLNRYYLSLIQSHPQYTLITEQINPLPRLTPEISNQAKQPKDEVEKKVDQSATKIEENLTTVESSSLPMSTDCTQDGL